MHTSHSFIEHTHAKILIRSSFHVGCLLTKFEWKCRFHMVESTFPLEFDGRELTLSPFELQGSRGDSNVEAVVH